MIIYVNNKLHEFDKTGMTVSELLDELRVKGGGVAIAVGVNIVKATERDSYALQNEDKVTIIGAAYGG